MGNHYYLPSNIYEELFAYLRDEVDPGTAAQFASYFDSPQGDLYHCNNYDGYMQWLAGLIDDGDYGLFVAWDQNMLLQSGQGGGSFNINPLP